MNKTRKTEEQKKAILHDYSHDMPIDEIIKKHDCRKQYVYSLASSYKKGKVTKAKATKAVKAVAAQQVAQSSETNPLADQLSVYGMEITRLRRENQALRNMLVESNLHVYNLIQGQQQ